MDDPLRNTTATKPTVLPARKTSTDPLSTAHHGPPAASPSPQPAASSSSAAATTSSDTSIPLILPLKINIDRSKSKKGNTASHYAASSSSTPSSSAMAPTTAQTAPKLKVKSIFDSSLNAHRSKSVSLSAFSHLFCAMVGYSQVGVKNVGELEDRLSSLGAWLWLHPCAPVCYVCCQATAWATDSWS